ncbi:MAG: uracil-DNA glycosylase [Vulcanimicrobiaceae bacterium]
MSIAERSARASALGAAAGRVEACRRCALGSTRRRSVYGEGDPCAGLMLVGEGPGETEDRLGRPFVGRAGELLERMLAAIGLAREDVYICNTVKCRPTLAQGERLRNRPPTPDEMAHCRSYLDEQIGIVRPRVILALGAPAARSFLGPTFSVGKQRGQWFDGPQNTPLLATYHPAYVLRTTGGELLAVKRLVWNDLQAVRARLDELARPARIEPQQAALFEGPG